MSVKRIYVEKKAPYAVEAKQLLWEIRHILQIKTVTGLRLLNRYDVEGVDDALYQKCLPVVFSEPQVDVTYTQLPHGAKAVFAVEYLPGQYDQRAASCEECIQLVGQCARPTVRSARVYLLDGDFTADELARVKKHVINPVEAREADLGEKTTLQQQYDTPDHVETLTGFTAMNADEVDAFVKKYGLAMDDDDLAFCRDYFASEHRDPTLTEIRMIDTYWSDHCRHTTFLTTLDAVDVRKAAVEKAFQRYLAARKTVYGDRERPMNLMDIATIGGKYLKKIGQTPNIDVSEEINACSIKIDVDVDGVKEPWLLMFKNETHNHPTEIEPFGGAATCLGGAIRDPLSGRTYVYQAMRVTGAADPTVSVKETLKGKLPQKKLVRGAAHGYSSYGNQIGLATGYVKEIYHPNYVAKRMEIGAVMGAAPRKDVIRETSDPGDLIILLGGETGRDGCGGATGSSKVHTEKSIETCGAEVQKGNAPTERKIQRLFRRPEVTRLIKKCNDFGAGGVSVAIGDVYKRQALSLSTELDRLREEGLEPELDAQVLEFWFTLRDFLNTAELLDENYVIYSELEKNGNFYLKLYCVETAENIRACLDKGRAAVFFSATLLPMPYYKHLLGAEDDYAVYARSPFRPEKRLLLLGQDVSSRYTRRNRSEYERIAAYLKQMSNARMGHYLAFFPSYRMMEDVYDLYLELDEGRTECVIQQSGMGEAQRETFLSRFREQACTRSLLGFCVLGGIFSEGIDLKGESLIGAAIVGTGLPQICNEREILRQYYEGRQMDGFAYAYRYPGMNKVLQAAGRVIRTEEDLGVVLLLDDRFGTAEYTRMFPLEWSGVRGCRSRDVGEQIEAFWKIQEK